MSGTSSITSERDEVILKGSGVPSRFGGWRRERKQKAEDNSLFY